MKKKILFGLCMFIATLFILPTVKAAENVPTKDTIGGKNFLFANGVPIVISANDEGKTIVTYGDNQTIELEEDTTVVGGSHAADVTSTNIKMIGGTVKNIVGGGLHQSTVKTADITITGGTVTGQVVGGGAASFSGTEGDSHTWYNGDYQNSTTVVEKVILKIEGGSINTVYGGGEGISNTHEVELTVTGEDTNIAWLCAAGSNGYTGSSIVTIEDGTIAEYASANRGEVNSVETNIEGGTITTLYVGTDGKEGSTWQDDGKINDVNVYVSGGKVKNAYIGYNDGLAKDNKLATDVGMLMYNPAFIENLDKTGFNESYLIETITVTFHAEGEEPLSFELPIGTKFNDEAFKMIEEAILEAIPQDYTYEGLFLDSAYTNKLDNEYTFTNPVDVYIKVVQAREAPTASDNPKDNPETADINLLLVLGIILAGSVGLAYTIKLRKFN